MSSIIERSAALRGRYAAGNTSAMGALTALSLSMLLASLGTSVTNVALPSLGKAFAASFQALQWIVLAYLLAVTTLVVGAGRLGDVTGRRRLLLVGVAVFTLASLLCGVAPTLPALILARGAQGIGAAIIMALTMAFVGDAVSPARTGSAMGLLGTMSALGTALGPSLGGVLLAGPGWRALFLINVPLGAVALFLAHRYLPADRKGAPPRRPAFDVGGTALLAFTLGAYALGVTIGHGRFGVPNVALLAMAALGALTFVRVEARTERPLVQLAMLADRALTARLGANALVATVVMATLVVGPFYLARALGLPTAMIGVAMSIGPLVAAVAGVPAGRLTDRYGAGRVSIAGLGVTTLGTSLLGLLPTSLGVLAYVTSIAIVTAGYALFQTANNAAVMSDVDAGQRGVVSGMLALSRNLGLITGASAMGALFAWVAGARDMTTVPPASVAHGMRATFAVATSFVMVALLATRRVQRR